MSIFNEILRVLADALQTPVIILLIILVLVTVVLTGVLIGEFFTEHRHLDVELPRLVDRMNERGADLELCIQESGLLKRQKKALLEVTLHPELTNLMREALAVRMIQTEQEVYDKRVRTSDLIAKLGPVLGLLGTLIPLGPGIIALGQGDTAALSASLLTAFDTTVAGLIAAGTAMVISGIRNSWYEKYMSILETLMECLLEVEKRNGYTREKRKAPQQ